MIDNKDKHCFQKEKSPLFFEGMTHFSNHAKLSQIIRKKRL